MLEIIKQSIIPTSIPTIVPRLISSLISGIDLYSKLKATKYQLYFLINDAVLIVKRSGIGLCTITFRSTILDDLTLLLTK